MVIYPDVTSTPDTPTIKFYQPRDQIDLSKELPRILHTQGWGCGTLFNVMFLNHEKTKLLSCGRFIVTEEIESVHTSDANPYQPMTKTVFSRCCEQIGNWWSIDSMINNIMPTVEKVYESQAKPMMDVVHPPLVDIKSEPTVIEPKRRGRPPKTVAA